MRVVTYNVSGGLDPAAAGGVLAGLEPDIVCVLEIPGAGRLRSIARRAGLEVVERAGKKGSGSAVLVQPDVRVRASSRVPLTTPKDLPSREAAHAIVSVEGLGLSITAVQLGLRPEVRRTNLDELVTFLRSIDLPSVLGCDLNESVRSPVASALASLYQDAHALVGLGSGATYPTSDPSSRQDFVFVDPDLRVTASFVARGDAVDVASHHRPVVADLEATDAVGDHADGASADAAAAGGDRA
jgi:endonuclease/exonuclease/phosphatase family metal-dependent hydrolase